MGFVIKWMLTDNLSGLEGRNRISNPFIIEKEYKSRGLIPDHLNPNPLSRFDHLD
jgi:hypothetical protein